MATMYAPGARRSAAPTYSPRAALTSEALYDDQVTKDLLDAMLSAVQPAGVGQSQAGVNLGEALGSGTSIGNFDFGGGESFGDSGGPAPASGPAGLGTVGDIGQAFSALAVLGQDPAMAQLGQVLGQIATVGTAASQAAQGNLGQAAMTVAPMGLSALGVPGGLTSVAMTAANPTLGPVDTQAAVVNAMLGTIAPPVAAALTIGQMLGLAPTAKSMLTPVENIDVNAMIAEQEAMQAAMEEGAAIAAGFGGVDGTGIGEGIGIGIGADVGGLGEAGSTGFGDTSVGGPAAADAGSTSVGGGIGEGAAVGVDGPGTAGDAGPGSSGGTDGPGDGTSDGSAGGGGGDGAGCFITTATVKHMGQQDDGEVLSTLRRFRDSYMRKNTEKIKDVAWYYKHAPRIVAALDSSPTADKLYREMYDNYIYPSYEAIKANNMERAYELYRAGVIFAQEASGINTSDLTTTSTSA